MSPYSLEPPSIPPVSTLLKHLHLPKPVTLKDGTPCLLTILDSHNDTPSCQTVRAILNKEIQRGTYPQDKQLSLEGFRSYFCSHYCFLLHDTPTTITPNNTNQHFTFTRKIRGAFYIKPNYPGRSSHICNAGFLVGDEYRGNGVGSAMADILPEFAKKLGFRGIFFNLVYEDNIASIKIWKKRGYSVQGRVPEAKLEPKPTDAIMMYKKLV